MSQRKKSRPCNADNGDRSVSNDGFKVKESESIIVEGMTIAQSQRLRIEIEFGVENVCLPMMNWDAYDVEEDGNVT